MENPNRAVSDRKKQYWPEGNASKNERRPQLQVNKAQIKAEYSDQDSKETVIDFKMKVVKPYSPEGQGLGHVIGNFKEPSDSLMEQILNPMRKHFGPEQPLNEQQVLQKFIDSEEDASRNKQRPQPKAKLEAEEDASKNKYRPQPKVKLEAEDSDQDLRKTMGEFKVKGVKPDSSRGQSTGPETGHFEESVKGKSPPVPRSRGHVSMSEHGVQLNVNLARLGTDSLRRYLRHFQIEGVNFDSSREQMLNAVQQHFASQPPLNEQQVIPEFIDAARRLKNKHIKHED